MKADAQEIRRTLQVMIEPGSVVELRALGVPNGKWTNTVSGYFDDLDTMAEEAARLSDAGAKGVYATLNPVVAALLARSSNKARVAGRDDPTTGDRDVAKRRWLLVDFDPERPSGISATDREKQAALELAREVNKRLRACGWPRPVAGDSGNGTHLLYPINLPADDGGLIQHVLEAIAFRFGGGGVKIDTSVFNPARICKLHGTAARKGDSTEDRPHRLSRLTHVPSALQVVPEELLRAVAAWRPKPDPKQSARPAGDFSIDAFISKHGLEVRGPDPWQGGRKWVLPVCPWNPEHRNGAAFIVEFPSRALDAGCHHDGCQGKTWRDLRLLFEPDAYAHERHDGGNDRRSTHDDSAKEEKARSSGGILLSSVVSERVEWLWSGRIPFGKPTILDGDPGLGKSTLALEIAARCSRGESLPGDDIRRPPAGVVILSAEDGLADTIRPRLEAARADLDRIIALQIVTALDGSEDLPEIPRDLPVIERAIREVGARLVIIDPLMAYLAAEISSHRDQDIRRALAPLAKLTEAMRTAMIIVRHLNKRAGDNPIYRGGGSIGIIGAARSGLLVAPDPDDRERRVLAVTKANLSKMVASLSFALVEAENEAVSIKWLGNSGHTAATLMAVPEDDEERSSVEAAMEVLRLILVGGAVSADDVRKQARAAGISDRTLDRAKARLGVRARKRGFSSGWEWYLPDEGRQSNDLGALRGDDAYRRTPTPEDPHAEKLGALRGNGANRSPQGRENTMESGPPPKDAKPHQDLALFEERKALLAYFGADDGARWEWLKERRPDLVETVDAAADSDEEVVQALRTARAAYEKSGSHE
jgi:RNase P/RNase MRP subunit POP5